MKRLRESVLNNTLSPAGVYFVTWGDVPVATACGLDRSSDPSSPVGELGWVAVDPAHCGKGLGLSVCVAVVRYLARAVQPLHDAGIKIIWHCDGDIRPILPQLINVVGVAGFQGFQEETGCTLETIASLRTCEGRKPIIFGSVSVTTTLPFGTVEDVKRDVERCFKVAAPGGGFALASSSSILPETPIANILALMEHGRRFGREFLRGLYG